MENKNSQTDSYGYWTPKHPRAFEEFARPRWAVNIPDHCVYCMKCDGHGGWNTGVLFKDDPRGPNYRFSRMECSTCNGRGTLDKKYDARTIAMLEQCGGSHNFVSISREQAAKLGLPTYRCMSAHQCTDCGFAQSFDSGD